MRAIVFTGLLRNPENLVDAVNFLQRPVQEGEAELYLSTWNRELEAHADLVPFLEENSVKIITSHEPSIVMPGHVVHQAMSLRNAISEINPSRITLKMRTDFYNKELLRFFLIRPPEETLGVAQNFLAQKITVPACIPAQPFFINDIYFSGQAGDLLRVFDPTLSASETYPHTNPEQILHSSLFQRLSPQLQWYFQTNTGLFHAKRKGFDAWVELMRNAAFGRFCLAYYFWVISAFYRSWFPKPDLDYSDITLDEFVFGDAPFPHTSPQHNFFLRTTQFVDWASPQNIRSFQKTPFRDQILDQIERFSAGEFYAPTEEVEEFVAMARDVAEIRERESYIPKIKNALHKSYEFLSAPLRHGENAHLHSLETQVNELRRMNEALQKLVAGKSQNE